MKLQLRIQREFPDTTVAPVGGTETALIDDVSAGGGGAGSGGVTPFGRTLTGGGATPAGGPTALPLALYSSPLGAYLPLGASPLGILGAFPSSASLGAFPSYITFRCFTFGCFWCFPITSRLPMVVLLLLVVLVVLVVLLVLYWRRIPYLFIYP
ncbi:hypothetical protein C1646_699788 [Rhizophagus diaphanus]|nr:hypothetical protein C1646_699788 [Rhizophagus diaphanus] [Rhizophagus sp. MUCL 43196]